MYSDSFSGVVPGEEVLLTPPLSVSVAADATEVIPDVEIPSLEDYQRRAEAERIATLGRQEEGRAEGGERHRPDKRERTEKPAAETPATPPAQAPTSSTLKPGVSAVAEARRAADAVVDARRSASAVAVVEPPRKTE